jgi:lipid-binding SYLF domain-containing protein
LADFQVVSGLTGLFVNACLLKRGDKLMRLKSFKALVAPAMAALVIATGSAGLNTPPAVAATATQINQGVSSTLDKFGHEVHSADDVLKNAKAILVFPSVYQGGIVVGGEYGEGALVVDGKTEGYYNLVSASYGFQLGAQKKSVVLAFMSDSALEHFRNTSGWKVGGDASVAIAKMGAEGSIDTDTLNKPIIGFVIGQKGLMYNLSLEGSKISKIQRN